MERFFVLFRILIQSKDPSIEVGALNILENILGIFLVRFDL